MAAKYGLKCAIIAVDDYPGEVSANILLDRILDCDLILKADDGRDEDEQFDELCPEIIKEYEEKVFEALTNCRGGIPQPPLKIRFLFTHGDLRRRDSDNQASSVLDLLVDTKIIPDDGWNVVRNIEIANGYEKGKPSVTVEISAAE